MSAWKGLPVWAPMHQEEETTQISLCAGPEKHFKEQSTKSHQEAATLYLFSSGFSIIDGQVS